MMTPFSHLKPAASASLFTNKGRLWTMRITAELQKQHPSLLDTPVDTQ